MTDLQALADAINDSVAALVAAREAIQKTTHEFRDAAWEGSELSSETVVDIAARAESIANDAGLGAKPADAVKLNELHVLVGAAAELVDVTRFLLERQTALAA